MLLIIDSETTRDRDDALAVESTTHGWRLHVAIALVAPAVPSDSPADQAALRQGATIYLPAGRTHPLLRGHEDRLSLAPDRSDGSDGPGGRQALHITIELGPTGEAGDVMLGVAPLGRL
jgi:exoribonuclease II